VPAGLTGIVAIAAGHLHSLALDQGGLVHAWGYDYWQQTSVPIGLSNIVAIAAGYHHSLALRSDGTVVAWGADYYGQLRIPEGLTNVIRIAGGGDQCLALVGPPPPNPELSLTNATAGEWGVGTPTVRGGHYVLEYTDSLDDPWWRPVGLPPSPGDNLTKTLIDPQAASTNRFYRIRVQ
jgi:hypothetical protein